MDDCEKLEEIQAIIDELADRALGGGVILVEGRRDRDALRRLGIAGEVVMTSYQSLLRLAERLARSGKDVIILTDWDDRGEEVARQLALYMETDGARPDTVLRCSLKGLLRKDIKDIESLYTYVEKLRETCSAKPQHY